MHQVPVDSTERGSQWPEQWPLRLEKPPYWLSTSQTGVYGRPAPEDFKVDYEHWKHVVSKSYLKGLGINWSSVRNIMDMRAVYGGLVNPSLSPFLSLSLPFLFYASVTYYMHQAFSVYLAVTVFLGG